MRQPTQLTKLRGQICNAVRWGNVEDEARFRRELVLAKVEDAIERHLAGVELTAAEFDRLSGALLVHRSRTELEAEVMASAGDALRLAELLIERLHTGQDADEAVQGAVRESALAVVRR